MAVRIVFIVKSKSKQKDQRCQRLRLGLVPMTTGCHRILPDSGKTSQYCSIFEAIE